ncbi:hypothetical protein ACOSP7_006573 [Xanthoceras sorbifolium]
MESPTGGERSAPRTHREVGTITFVGAEPRRLPQVLTCPGRLEKGILNLFHIVVAKICLTQSMSQRQSPEPKVGLHLHVVRCWTSTKTFM